MTNKEVIILLQEIEEDGRNVSSQHIDAIKWAVKVLDSYKPLCPVDFPTEDDPYPVCTCRPSQGEWIPVSERLPSHDEYIKNNGLFNVSDGNRSYSEWFDIYDKQGFGEPTMAGFRVDYAVTAWQPLPEPYKRGGEEE